MKEIYLINMDSDKGRLILTLEGDEDLIEEFKAITWEEYGDWSPNKYNKCENLEEAYKREEVFKQIKDGDILDDFDLDDPTVIEELEDYQYEPYMRAIGE